MSNSNPEKNFEEYAQGEFYQGTQIEYIYAADNIKDYIILNFKDNPNITYATKHGSYSDKEISVQLRKVNHLLKTDTQRYEYLDYIANAYRQCFEGNILEANEILKNVEQKIIHRRNIVGRLRYATIFVAILLINVFIAFLIKNSENVLSIYIKKDILMLFYIAVWGNLGGFLSMALKLKEIEFDPDEDNKTYILNSLIRVLISMIAAIISYIIIKSNILEGLFNPNINNYYLYTIAILAGFSEKFVPNLLNKIENNTQNKEKN